MIPILSEKNWKWINILTFLQGQNIYSIDFRKVPGLRSNNGKVIINCRPDLQKSKGPRLKIPVMFVDSNSHIVARLTQQGPFVSVSVS